MFNKLLDLSIIYSFDQSGYQRHARLFSELNAVKFAGKHFLVTGGSRGIGGAVTQALLAMGAEVTVTARTQQDFDANFAGQAGVSFQTLDLGNFEAIQTLHLGLYDGLVLNAGGMPSQPTLVDGQFDTIFGAQVVGHYLLLDRLIEEDRLRTGAPVHWVASGGMYLHKLQLDDLGWQQRPYDKVTSYANAKRAQVVLNGLLAQRYKKLVFSCSHPGWVGTDALAKALPGFTNRMGKRLRTAEQGADTILWCLEQRQQLKSGLFWFDRHPRQTRVFFWTQESEADRLALLALLESVKARY